MSYNVYRPPKANLEISDQARISKRPILVWFAAGYLLLFGLLQIVGFILALRHSPEPLSLWKYFFIYTPVYLRIFAGITLFRLKKIMIPILVIVAFFTVINIFLLPIVLGIASQVWWTIPKSFPLSTLAEWSILFFIIYYCVTLWRKGVLM